MDNSEKNLLDFISVKGLLIRGLAQLTVSSLLMFTLIKLNTLNIVSSHGVVYFLCFILLSGLIMSNIFIFYKAQKEKCIPVDKVTNIKTTRLSFLRRVISIKSSNGMVKHYNSAEVFFKVGISDYLHKIKGKSADLDKKLNFMMPQFYVEYVSLFISFMCSTTLVAIIWIVENKNGLVIELGNLFFFSPFFMLASFFIYLTLAFWFFIFIANIIALKKFSHLSYVKALVATGLIFSFSNKTKKMISKGIATSVEISKNNSCTDNVEEECTTYWIDRRYSTNKDNFKIRRKNGIKTSQGIYRVEAINRKQLSKLMTRQKRAHSFYNFNQEYRTPSSLEILKENHILVRDTGNKLSQIHKDQIEGKIIKFKKAE